MIGQRIKLARMKAGLSMRALAAQLDPPVSAQAISKYESNKMMPSSRILMSIGKVLDVSLDFLMSSQVIELSGVEFRKKSTTTAKDRHRVEAMVIDEAERYLVIEDILGLKEPSNVFSDLKNKRVSNFEEVDEYAVQLRMLWNLGLDPLPSMMNLLEDKGIKVVEADLPDGVDGLTCFVHRADHKDDIKVIVVSKHYSVERKRFTLAHELGHWVIGSVEENGIDLEKAVNRFAGSFLIPERHLRDEVGDERQSVAYEEFIRIKHIYGVSAAALLYRMHTAGILSHNYIRHAFQTFAKPWRTKEPEPLEGNEGVAAFEKPQRFNSLVYRALSERMIPPVRAAELMNKSLAEVEYGMKGPQLA